ncbi:MAG: chromosome segregation protein SMC [Oscillospiraceae bacterium]|nr:chromosome segregation protein SMC [Oscillospiraceae bacterium]
MVLKALEIQGFKSFPDKIRINFDKGVTGVVGPNGSGKSNISDAIRWVLGETSARQLRGGGKMENVIFSGTGGKNRRAAMGYASVRLVLDNTDRLIDVDTDEVTIGRKYYRSGESEYSINGQAVRLRDVYELFLDTGLGRDGYSIIGQGRIAEIVSSKSSERREIFEEASGIARYRYRKNEAERRLAASEENLSRLRDILGELESRVGPLEKESQKAKSYLEYAARRKDLEVTLWMEEIQRARDAVRVQQRRLEIAQSDYDSDDRKINELDGEIETLRGEIERLLVQADDANRAIRAIAEEAAGFDSRIAVLNNDIEHNLAAVAELREAIAADEADEGQLAGQVAAAEAAIAACEKDIAGYAEKIARQERLLEELMERSRASGERRDELAAALALLNDKITQLKVEGASAASGAEMAAQRLAAANEELTAARETVTTLTQDHADTLALDAHLDEELTRLGNIREGLVFKLDSRKASLAKAQEAANAVDREIQTAVQRIKMLRDLERSMDGYHESVKAVIKAGENRRLRGIIGTVGSLLKVKPGYELAIETALGAALQNIIVTGESAAKAAIAWLKDERAGRATFLPLDTVQPYRLQGAKLGDAVLACDVVEADEKYADIVSNLLGRIAVAEDMNDAGALARANNYRFRIVTLDGQVVNAGGSYTGGSSSRSAGVFSRKLEIEETNARLTGLDAKLKEAQAQVRRFSGEVDALTAELTATESEIITRKGEKIRSGMELERLKTALSQQNAAAELLDGECESLRDTIAKAQQTQQSTEKQTAEAVTEVGKLEEELSVLDGDGSFAETHTRLSGELGELRLAQAGCGKDIELHRQTIASLQGRSGQSQQQRELRLENIGRLEQLVEGSRREIALVEQQKESVRARIAEQEELTQAIGRERIAREGRITALTNEQRTLTAHREEMSRETARLSERQDALKSEYESNVNKLWEEYELTLTDAAACCIEFENITELRRQATEIRAKIKALGNVNVAAIDEYAEVSQRYNFMKAQVDDVEKAKAELLRLIAELSGEMKEIFSVSFARINENFGHIFAELFGGGTASLTLTEPDDILESGIDISVAPPGKLIKNLTSLSGGEQALVAVSIYFAILAVNPSPFCVLDEIEAALDDVNVVRYAQYLHRISDKTQFIVITHRRGTMETADMLYGVTMQEDGVSRVLRLDPNNVDVSLIGAEA